MKRPIIRHLAWHKWATDRLFALLDQLPEPVYMSDRGSSHGGIHGTAVHIYGAEKLWIDRINGNPEAKIYDEELFPEKSWNGLKTAWVELSDGLFRDVMEWPELFWEKKIYYRTIAGLPFEHMVVEILDHVIAHAAYHRGQIISMVRQAGKEDAQIAKLQIQSLDLMEFYRTT